MHPFMIGKLIVGGNQWLYRSIGFAVLSMIGFFPVFWRKERVLPEER
jgi:hypothetical protein